MRHHLHLISSIFGFTANQEKYPSSANANTQTHTNTYIHIYIHIHICIYICISLIRTAHTEYNSILLEDNQRQKNNTDTQ